MVRSHADVAGAVPPVLLRAMQREVRGRTVPWHRIFNAHLRPGDTGRRYTDARQMVYDASTTGASDRPHDAASLPALRRWGTVVVRALQRHLRTAPRLRLAALGYVRTKSRTPQAWHRDVPVTHPGIAWSAFTPVNCPCPGEDPGAFRYVPLEDDATPGARAARAVAATDPGDLFLMDSRSRHRGGARPRVCADRWRVVAFAAVVERGRPAPDYGLTVPV